MTKRSVAMDKLARFRAAFCFWGGNDLAKRLPKGRQRRFRGEGTIYKKGTTFVGAISLGYRADGKRDRRYVFADTEDEARRLLDQLILDYNNGLLPEEPSRQTLADLMQSWLELRKPYLEPTTYSGYEILVRRHIAPYIGHHQVSKLKPLHIQNLLLVWEQSGVTDWQRAHAYPLLRQILDYAVEMDMLAKNPCKKGMKPKRPEREHRPLTLEEVRRVLQAAKGDRFEALWVLCICTGMRLGELLGLTWNRVDLDAGVLWVEQALTEVRGHVELGGLKTNSSKRRIDLPELAVDALRKHRAKGVISELVFPNTRGGPMRHGNLRNRHWRPILKRAGLDARIHDLRHTIATVLFDQGTPVHEVSALLGHARPSITTDIYGHRTPGRGRDVAATIQRVLRDQSTGFDRSFVPSTQPKIRRSLSRKR